eukprot:1146839-Pelagomonas_calceolata.AAC.1
MKALNKSPWGAGMVNIGSGLDTFLLGFGRAHYAEHTLYQFKLQEQEHQEQFKDAVDEDDHEKACFCLRSMIVHDTKDFTLVILLGLMLCVNRKGRFIGEAVQSGQAEFVLKQLCATARRAKRAYTKRRKAEFFFLGRIYSKIPDLHVMFRQPKPAQITPLAEPAWVTYLNEHFRPSTHQQSQRLHHGHQGLSAKEIAVPLGRNLLPPGVLLRQGTSVDWTTEPDSVSALSLDTMRSLVADQIKKMNGSASPGFDEIAAPFIQGADILWPKLNGTESVSVLEPFVAKILTLLHGKARIPACWKHAKLSPLYKKGPLLDPNSNCMLAISCLACRMYINVVRALLTDWCQEANKYQTLNFYLGRNTLQPMFTLCHLQHAAYTVQANNSSRLHAAFIDFKQAYDTIPREALRKE